MKSSGLIKNRKLITPFKYRVVYSGEPESNLQKESRVNEIVERIIENGRDKVVISERTEDSKAERTEMKKDDNDVKFYISLLRPKSRDKDSSVKDYLTTLSTQSQISVNLKKSLSPRPETIREIIPEKVNKTFTSGISRVNEKSTTEPSRRSPYQAKPETKRITNLKRNPSNIPINSPPTISPLIYQLPSQDYKYFLKKAIQITSSKKRCKAQGDLYQSYQSLIHYLPSNPYS